jgi:hypothetical protein
LHPGKPPPYPIDDDVLELKLGFGFVEEGKVAGALQVKRPLLPEDHRGEFEFEDEFDYDLGGRLGLRIRAGRFSLALLWEQPTGPAD